MKSLFVEVIGQHDNVGDSLLRRGMLDSIRHPKVELHVQVGPLDDYVTGLGLRDEDVIYRDRARWVAALGEDRGLGRSSFLANAGEAIAVRGPRYLRPRVLRQLVSLRRRGGALLHTGVGVRDLETRRWLAKMSALRYFDLVTWRDAPSRDYAGIGEVQPDWGFATGPSTIESDSGRDVLAVSVRGDREGPSDEWIAAVRELAGGLGLRIVTFSQVVRDSELAAELGRRLDADDVILWGSTNHAMQEARVRALFRQSTGVISDRVHGLIVGATEGAYPIGLPPRPNPKSQRTLAPVGFPLHVPAIQGLTASIDQLGESDLLGAAARATETARRKLSSRAAQIVDHVLSR